MEEKEEYALLIRTGPSRRVPTLSSTQNPSMPKRKRSALASIANGKGCDTEGPKKRAKNDLNDKKVAASGEEELEKSVNHNSELKIMSRASQNKQPFKF